MKNYQIITDEKILQDFVDNWLPDLKETERFYVALFARKKYDESLKSTSTDRMQLKRTTATKENLIHKLRQMEVTYGNYKLKNTIATQESLAVYITPNPRCIIKANKNVLMRFAKAVSTENYFHSLHSEALSCLQRSKSYAHVVDFDIDDKSVDLRKLDSLFPPMAGVYDVLETRGGYHILVFPSRIDEYNTEALTEGTQPIVNNWFKELQNLYVVDRSGDGLIPIPGCTQGMFTPKFL